MKKQKYSFFLLLALVIVTCFIAAFGLGDSIKGAGQMRFGIDIRGGIEAVFEPIGLSRKPTSSELEAARNVIETRLDSKNILEREVTVDSREGYIIVRFPWKSDETEFNPEAAIAELGETAQLTFRDPEGNVLIEGSRVKNSQVAFNRQSNEYVVQLRFDDEGSKLFADATEQLIGKNMGIYMDDTMISNPRVNESISGGEAVISGMANMEEAQELSEKINAGALPFSMDTSNFSSISPTLGSGALNTMVIAGVIAFALICIFMITYYKLSGIMSCIALCLQAALQLLVLSVPQFTLTLPGIAGIILSLGMAVDANVIISERISEEIANGLTVRQAIKRGYERAFSSVFDGNFTSAIVAILLMVFGSGTMLSFGYTLLTGLVINFAAGIFVSKHLLLNIVQFKKMNSPKLFRKKKPLATIPFYKKRKIAFGISILLVVLGIASSFIFGVKLDTQFAGGAVLKYSFEGDIDTQTVTKDIEAVVNRSVSTQITTDPATGNQKLVITLSGNDGLSPEKQEEILNKLNENMPEANYELSESYIVEPYIGKTALNKSILAIVLSCIFITVYVWFRFKTLSGLSAGVMAVVALIYDVFIVFFVFVWFKIPLNDAYVAVTLTIIGYSINDTIILYDRIRENKANLKMSKGAKKIDLGELVSESITQTLSRSINTTLTTTMCVLCILIFSILYGIKSIEVFALPMLVGIISGCYSSVCIAGPLWVSWQKWKEKHIEGKSKGNPSKGSKKVAKVNG